MAHLACGSLFLAAVLGSGDLAGQQRPGTAFLGPRPSRLFALPDTVPVIQRGDYHVEAGLIGAGTVGVLGALVGYGLCADSDTQRGSCAGNALGLGLAGAVVGWVTGSLIGGLIPKGP